MTQNLICSWKWIFWPTAYACLRVWNWCGCTQIQWCPTFWSVNFENIPKKSSEPFSLQTFYAVLLSHCKGTCKILCFKSFITHTPVFFLDSYLLRAENNLLKETSEIARYIIASSIAFIFIATEASNVKSALAKNIEKRKSSFFWSDFSELALNSA